MNRIAAVPRGRASTLRTLFMLTVAVPVAVGAIATRPAFADAADPAAGKAVFQSMCSSCHSPQSGRNMIGPSLFGVVGRTAGQVPGFHYSAANKASDLVWSTDELDKYLASPSGIVPHTTMTFGGLHDATKRANLIAYLETLK